MAQSRADIQKVFSVNRPALVGALHSVSGLRGARKPPRTSAALVAGSHPLSGCKTCKGRGCVGRCRF